MSLWFPFQVVSDTRRATHPVLVGGALVGWWWFGFLGWAFFLTVLNDPSAGRNGLLSQPFFVAAGPILCVLAAAGWIRILTSVSRDQAQAAGVRLS